MKRRVHRAFVEEGFDPEFGEAYFAARCFETLIECDAYGYVDQPVRCGTFGADANYPTDDELAVDAIGRALKYLGTKGCHEPGSEHFCDAEHVL